MDGCGNRRDAVGAGGGFERLLVKRHIGRGRRVEHQRGAGDPWPDLLEYLNPLAAQRRLDVDEPGDVAAGTRQAFDESAPDRIGNDEEHDGDGFGFALERGDDLRRVSDLHIRLQGDQLFRKNTHAIDIGGGVADLDLDVAALDLSEFAKGCPECRQPLDDLRIALGPAEHHADPPRLSALLSMRGQRPSRRHATEQRDELAPSHATP